MFRIADASQAATSAPVDSVATNTLMTAEHKRNDCGVNNPATIRAETKKPNILACWALAFMAERQGFEPWVGYKPTPVFKTGAFNRSATSPKEQKDTVFFRKNKGKLFHFTTGRLFQE